jgi:predicted Zn-dependent protease
VEDQRIEALKKMLATRPDDPRALFGLALEYERLSRWQEVVDHLQAYLRVADDEGNAYGRLARALRHLGMEAKALDAYRTGIEEAGRHGHPSLALELEEEMEEI